MMAGRGAPPSRGGGGGGGGGVVGGVGMPGGSAAAGLPDEDDEVDQEELDAFAIHLGMDPVREHGLMWICRMALQAPVPEGWSAHEDGDGNTYFYNETKGLSSWEHPSDEFFRMLYKRCKAVEGQASSQSEAGSAAAMANQELNGQLELLKKKHAELKVSADRVLMENDELARRSAEGLHDLEEQKQRHLAEVEALRALNVRSGSQAAEVPRLEQEVSEMMTQLRVAEAELQRYKQGVSLVGDQTDRLVEQLQKQLASEREESKLIRAELDNAVGRAGELEARIAKLNAVSLHDKQQVGQLRVELEEAARGRDAQVAKLTSEASGLYGQLARVMKQALADIKAAEEKNSSLEKAAEHARKQRSRDESEWKLRLEDALTKAEQRKCDLDKVRMGGSQAGKDSGELRDALDSARTQISSLSHQIDKLEKDNLDLADSESDHAVRLQRAEGLLAEAQAAVSKASEKNAKDREDILTLRKESEHALSIARESLSRTNQLEILKKGMEDNLQTTIREANDRELKLQVDLEGQKERVRELEFELGDVRRRADDAEAAITDAHLVHSHLKEKCDRQEEQLARAKEASARVASSLHGVTGGSSAGGDNVGQTISALLSQVESLRAEMSDTEGKMEHLSLAKVAAEDALSHEQHRTASMRQEKAKLDGALAQQTSSLAAEREARMRAQADLQRERQDIRQQIGSLQSDLLDAKKEVESHASGHAASQVVIRLLERRVKEQQESQKEMSEKGAKLRDDIESLRLSRARAEAESRRMVLSFSHEIREYQSQLSSERMEKKELRNRLNAPSVSGQDMAKELIAESDRARSECEKQRKLRQGVEMELDQFKSEHQDQVAVYNELCEQYEELKKQHAETVERELEAERQRTLAEKQLSELSERNRRLTSYIAEDGDHLREQIQILESEITRLGRERRDMARRLASVTERAEGAEKNVRDCHRDRERMRLQVERLKGTQLNPSQKLSWEASEGKGGKGNTQDDALQRENDEMLTVVSELREALRKVGPKMREIEVANNQLQSEAEVIRAQSEAARQYWQNQLRHRASELTSREETIEQLEKDITEVRRDADRFRWSNEALRGQVQELQASLSRLASHAKGAQNAVVHPAGPTFSAGRGVMGLRMRTPAAAPYNGLHQYSQPPLPRAGNPVRPKSKAGFSSSRASSRAVNPAALQFMPVVEEKKASDLPSPYTAAPRPQTSSRPFALPTNAQAAPPPSLLSPDVMENLLGLRPPGGAPSTPSARPSPMPGTAGALYFSQDNGNSVSIREADLGSAQASGSLLKEYDRWQSQKTSLFAGVSVSGGGIDASGITFCSGLAKATPVTGQPSGVREVHVDSPAVRGADRGRAMQLHGVPEDMEETPVHSYTSGHGGVPGNPLMPIGPPPNRPVSRPVSRAATTSGGGHGWRTPAEAASAPAPPSASHLSTPWISLGQQNSSDDDGRSSSKSGVIVSSSSSNATSSNYDKSNSAGGTSRVQVKNPPVQQQSGVKRVGSDAAAISVGSDGVVMSEQEELAAILVVPSASKSPMPLLPISKKSKACIVM